MEMAASMEVEAGVGEASVAATELALSAEVNSAQAAAVVAVVAARRVVAPGVRAEAPTGLVAFVAAATWAVAAGKVARAAPATEAKVAQARVVAAPGLVAGELAAVRATGLRVAAETAEVRLAPVAGGSAAGVSVGVDSEEACSVAVTAEEAGVVAAVAAEVVVAARQAMVVSAVDGLGAEEKEVESLAVAPRAAVSTEAGIRVVRVVANQEEALPEAGVMARAARAVAEA